MGNNYMNLITKIKTEELVRKLNIFCDEAQELIEKYPFAVFRFDEEKLNEFIGDNIEVGTFYRDECEE